MVVGRLERIDFLQFDFNDRLFVFPSKYRGCDHFGDAELLEISSKCASLLSIYGTEQYSLFSSRAIGQVSPDSGPLSINQYHLLREKTESPGHFVSLEAKDPRLLVITPTRSSEELKIDDMIILKGGPMFPFLSADDDFHQFKLSLGSQCKYRYDRSNLLEAPYDPQKHNLTKDKFDRLYKLYRQRMAMISRDLVRR